MLALGVLLTQSNKISLGNPPLCKAVQKAESIGHFELFLEPNPQLKALIL